MVEGTCSEGKGCRCKKKKKDAKGEKRGKNTAQRSFKSIKGKEKKKIEESEKGGKKGVNEAPGIKGAMGGATRENLPQRPGIFGYIRSKEEK